MSLRLDSLARIYHVLRHQLWLGAKDFDEDELQGLQREIEDELKGLKMVIVKSGRRD